MDTQRIVTEIRQHGFSVLSGFSAGETRDIKAFLLTRPVYTDAHVPETARKAGRHKAWRSASLSSECVCIDLPDAILCPHIFDRGLELTDVAGTYLDCDPPLAYSMNAFWTRPGPGAIRPDIQEMHVDADDIRFLVMFVYLNDVITEQDGPQDLEGPDGVTRTIYGPAGTVFLADTSRPHRGRKPISGERGLAWFRWGVSNPPPAYTWDGNAPITANELGSRYPTDSRLRESIRLIAR